MMTLYISEANVYYLLLIKLGSIKSQIRLFVLLHIEFANIVTYFILQIFYIVMGASSRDNLAS